MTDTELQIPAQEEGAVAPAPARRKNPTRTRQVNPVLEQLFKLYPKMFGSHFLPLKLGVFQDLLALHPDVFKRDELKVALGLHARSTRYLELSLIHISEPTRLGMISYAVFCLKKKKKNK